MELTLELILCIAFAVIAAVTLIKALVQMKIESGQSNPTDQKLAYGGLGNMISAVVFAGISVALGVFTFRKSLFGGGLAAAKFNRFEFI